MLGMGKIPLGKNTSSLADVVQIQPCPPIYYYVVVLSLSETLVCKKKKKTLGNSWEDNTNKKTFTTATKSALGNFTS